eukprot:g5927.t1
MDLKKVSSSLMAGLYSKMKSGVVKMCKKKALQLKHLKKGSKKLDKINTKVRTNGKDVLTLIMNKKGPHKVKTKKRAGKIVSNFGHHFKEVKGPLQVPFYYANNKASQSIQIPKKLNYTPRL